MSNLHAKKQEILRDAGAELAKVCDSLKRLCGEWHDWDCSHDEKPCHCNLVENRAKVKQTLSSSLDAYALAIAEEAEGRKKGDNRAYNDGEDERYGYNSALTDFSTLIKDSVTPTGKE